MTTDHEKYKNEARKQWNNNPCGATLGDQQTLEYFKSVEVARYNEYAPWMKRFYGFSEHRGLKVLEIGFGQGTDLVQFAEGGLFAMVLISHKSILNWLPKTSSLEA